MVVQAASKLSLVQMGCDVLVRHLLEPSLKQIGFLYHEKQVSNRLAFVSPFLQGKEINIPDNRNASLKRCSVPGATWWTEIAPSWKALVWRA